MASRFFADTVSWNRTAAELGEAVGMGDYVRRFWHAFGREPSAQRKMQPKTGDYSVSIFDARQATTKVRLAQTVNSQRQRANLGNVAIGSEIPWNPKWARVASPNPSAEPNQLPGGTDRCCLIVDYETGECWELWETAAPHAECVDWLVLPFLPFNTFRAFGGPNGRAKFVVGSSAWMGVGTCFYTPNIYTSDGQVDGRGSGISKAALTVRWSELEAGVIPHALAGVFTNPMAGPLASKPNTTLDPEAGKTKVFYLPPGRKAEYADTANGPRYRDPANVYPITDGCPTGIRYAIKITDERIEEWLDEFHGDGPLRDLARIFAVALRDYGIVYAETGGYAVGIECESARTPAGAAAAQRLGIRLGSNVSGTPLGELLVGIFDYGQVYVVKAAA